MPGTGLGRLAVLIPVWQPAETFPAFVSALAGEGFAAIVVVDDGSDRARNGLFDQVAALPSVHLVRHPRNLGKGRALKTGMQFFLTELSDLDGLITADADGQHRPADVVRVAHALQAHSGAMVLGSRAFSGAVPLRNRVGNWLTRRVFAVATGERIADTQSGLRGLPGGLLPELLSVGGERYEYETAMLAHVCRRYKPIEVPIETIYLEGNRASHFRPVRDSVRIYGVLARLCASGLWRRVWPERG